MTYRTYREVEFVNPSRNITNRTQVCFCNGISAQCAFRDVVMKNIPRDGPEYRYQGDGFLRRIFLAVLSFRKYRGRLYIATTKYSICAVRFYHRKDKSTYIARLILRAREFSIKYRLWKNSPLRKNKIAEFPASQTVNTTNCK